MEVINYIYHFNSFYIYIKSFFNVFLERFGDPHSSEQFGTSIRIPLTPRFRANTFDQLMMSAAGHGMESLPGQTWPGTSCS